MGMVRSDKEDSAATTGASRLTDGELDRHRLFGAAGCVRTGWYSRLKMHSLESEHVKSKNGICRRVAWGALACLWLVAGQALAEQGPAVELGPRFVDSLRGMSICPPAGAEVARKFTGVEFDLRDKKTGAIRLAMRVQPGEERKVDTADLQEYARRLALQLRADQNFEVRMDTLRTMEVGGKPAIDLRGVTGGGNFGLFRRDVWVRTTPNRFWVVRTTGPATDEETIVRVSDASLKTMRFVDPEAARALREQQLSRGAALLERLDRDDIVRQVAPRDYWLAILVDGKLRGFSYFQEQVTYRDGEQGLSVLNKTAFVNEDQTILSRQEMFATFDRRMGNWQASNVILQDGKEIARDKRFGIKQAELLLVQTEVAPGELRDTKHKVPTGIFVPMALTPVLPRLVASSYLLEGLPEALQRLDTKGGEGGAFGFAYYSSVTDRIEMRTLQMQGPRNLTISGRSYQAQLLEDQMSADAEPAEVYLGADGLPLKIISRDPNGRVTVLQQTTGEAIRKHFADELRMIQ